MTDSNTPLTKNIKKMMYGVGAVVLIVVLSYFYSQRFERIRDIRRIADINAIQSALEIYYDTFDTYPYVASADVDEDGWDYSFEPEGGLADFMRNVRDAGFLESSPLDPSNDGYYYYRYQMFPDGSYGCDGGFYILQVMEFEDLNEDNPTGTGYCPDRDFKLEVPYGLTWQRFVK